MKDDLPSGLAIEQRDAVRVVSFSRPEQFNAVDGGLHAALADIWSRLAADPDARAVVLTGSGRAFCGGADLDWMTRFHAESEFRRRTMLEAKRIVREMLDFPLPVVAAVNGPAVGLGCSVAILCDAVFIHESAYFADPHVAMGLVAGDGGAAFWPILINLLRAKELLFTGDRISSADAVMLGLANRLVRPPDDVVEEACTLATRWAALPRYALQQTKRALNLHLERALPILEYGMAAESESFVLADHKAALEQARQRTTSTNTTTAVGH